MSENILSNYCPAQYVIIDVGIPTPAHITVNILTAIQNVLSLRSRRVPAIGVALINSVFQQVVSISNTNTQLHKILHALKSVMDTGKCRARISMEETKDNIYAGIKKALEDFQSFPQELKDDDICPLELQIMILSMKNGCEVQFYLTKLLTVLPTERLKKIQVVEVVEDYMEVDAYNSHGGGSVPSFVEFLRVPGSSARLEELLKQWLVRGPSAQVGVRLVLKNCVVLCDVRECLVHSYNVASSRQQIIQEEAGTLNLVVVHRLAADGLCETQMCGDPVTLVPSQCYQMSWTDKELNQQCYLTLIEKVMMTEEYLVAKKEIKGEPTKYFILMPGEEFFLMRILITAEVAMPSPKKLIKKENYEIDSVMTTSLLSVPTLKFFNSADFSTGLYKQLIESVLHPARRASQAGPSRAAASQETQDTLCRDPSHKSIVVDVEIKKTIRRKKSFVAKCRKNQLKELPKLSLSDQQTLNNFFSKKKRDDSSNK